jgi:Pyruvate-formate lyase
MSIKAMVKKMAIVQYLLLLRLAVRRQAEKALWVNQSDMSSPLWRRALSSTLKYSYIYRKKAEKCIFRMLRVSRVWDDRGTFFYCIDFSVIPLFGKSVIGNLTPDYSRILKRSLVDTENIIPNDSPHSRALRELHLYAKRCIGAIDASSGAASLRKRAALESMLERPADSLFEAMQRYLFLNQVLWLERHSLIGLGRLDDLFWQYYENDIARGTLSDDGAFNLVKEFLRTLHMYYPEKSSALLGDTGQIIILGGIRADGTYCHNRLTELFIAAIKELGLPDPKALLRTHSKMPKELMDKAINCALTGIGSPLFASDEAIIPRLVEFGYDSKDVFEYGTSACWEPLLIGMSSDANNLKSINFCKPLADLLKSHELGECRSFEALQKRYLDLLYDYVRGVVSELKGIRWEKAPILSLFVDDCVNRGLDLSEGGAKYANYGLTSVALSNAVNSLLVIKKYVYESKTLAMGELIDLLNRDYQGGDHWRKAFKNEEDRFGADGDGALGITKKILETASRVFEGVNAADLGYKVKFGLSSPNYIVESHDFPATPDGRRKGDPFGVHISNDKPSSYTSLFAFASTIDYSHCRFNGNVVDLFVPPSFVAANETKFASLISKAMTNGVFQMQMNVVSSAILIHAKAHPDEHQNLIVRVWGFSSYFRDLPEAYQDLLIDRALRYENASC